MLVRKGRSTTRASEWRRFWLLIGRCPLSPAQEEAIEGILQEAREYYRKAGLISDEEWRLYQEDLGSPDYPYA